MSSLEATNAHQTDRDIPFTGRSRLGSLTLRFGARPRKAEQRLPKEDATLQRDAGAPALPEARSWHPLHGVIPLRGSLTLRFGAPS